NNPLQHSMDTPARSRHPEAYTIHLYFLLYPRNALHSYTRVQYPDIGSASLLQTHPVPAPQNHIRSNAVSVWPRSATFHLPDSHVSNQSPFPERKDVHHL